MEVVVWIVLGFALVRLGVAMFNLFTNPLLPVAQGEIIANCQVSVLIPARNEAGNIGTLLEKLLIQSEWIKEVLVLNDHSTDATEQVVNSFSERNTTVKLINGKELPQGWLGKNYACHQLSEAASGDYLLFLDADVQIEKGAIAAGVERLEKYKLDLLSIFPDQIMHSFGEKLVVPLMHYLLLSLLPLKFVRTLGAPSLAAANGQYMLFRAATYKKNYFHEKVKNEVVEDVEIMKLVKTLLFKGEVLLGNRLINARMYQNGADAVNGFTKNLFSGFGKSILGMNIYFALIFWLWPLVFVWGTSCQWLLSLLAIFGIRFCISLISHQSVIQNFVLHTVQMYMYVWIGMRSMLFHKTGRVTWKGRSV